MQRHPFKPLIMHIDFMRVSAEEVLRMSVPLHFVGEERSPAGKASGVVIQHQVTDVEIAALPKDLPEFLSVDLSQMDAGDVVMLSDILLPEGVTIPALDGRRRTPRHAGCKRGSCQGRPGYGRRRRSRG